jgi:N,N'-diacetyllegionaminate synthase
MKIKISNKWIGDNSPVFVTAEVGINHNGSLKLAKKLVKSAKDSGADAIKFQTFKASDIATQKSKFYKIFKKVELDESDYGEISDYAKSNSIIFFSTPVNESAVDILLKLKVPAFKIGSGNLTNIPVIKYAASKRKPMIVSTGMSNIDEINLAINSIKKQNNNKIILMHSVSSYPTPTNETNLSVIKNLEKKFPYPIGYSDNGSDSLVPIASVMMGAKIIEKHFTINKKLKGSDHFMSADPTELKQIVKNVRFAETMFGDGIKKCQPSELENRTQARRSITSKITIDKGLKITQDMLTFKRPATGIEPRYYKKIIGKKVKKKIHSDHPIKWNDLL